MIVMHIILQLFYKCLSKEGCVEDFTMRIIESTSFKVVSGDFELLDSFESDHFDLAKIARMQGFSIDGMECSLSQN
jgi:hypothetical protein